MSELDKPITRVWRRMRFQRFLTALVWCWAATLLVVAVTLIVEKLTNRALPGEDWVPFAIAGGVGLVMAAIIAVTGGATRLDAAIAIDRAYSLNERLSTAITLPGDLLETMAGQALFRDAVKSVTDLDVRTAFSPKLPRLAWVPVLPALLAVAIPFAPQIATLKAQAKGSLDPKIEKKVIEAQTKSLGKKIASQRKALEKGKFPETENILAKIEKGADDLAKAPPGEKEKALVAMNKLADALKDRQKQLGSPEQVNRQLQQLKDNSTQGPADKFAKELSKGEFMKAANEMKKLQEQLKSDKMTEKDKSALKEQLAEMSKQLEKLANLDERKKQLQEAVKNGGLSKEQFDQEMSKLEQQSKSLQKLSQLANKLAEAQDAMAKGDTKKAAEKLGMSEQQLSEMAKNMEELASLDEAMAQLQEAKDGINSDDLNQLGEALGAMGAGDRQGTNGANGLGRGRGRGDRPEAPAATSTYTTKVKQQLGKGKAVAEGTAPSTKPVKGQSFIDIQAEIVTNTGNSADALSNQKVPRNIEKHIKGYFDQINNGK